MFFNSCLAFATLNGHTDYSYSCAWSVDGNVVATGNQDKTARLYDIRNTSTAFKILPAKMGAVRSLHFSGDGRFLAMAEPGRQRH
jgi:WD40 repeat protein